MYIHDEASSIPYITYYSTAGKITNSMTTLCLKTLVTVSPWQIIISTILLCRRKTIGAHFMIRHGNRGCLIPVLWRLIIPIALFDSPVSWTIIVQFPLCPFLPTPSAMLTDFLKNSRLQVLCHCPFIVAEFTLSDEKRYSGRMVFLLQYFHSKY